jgi:hypothetical protein
MFNSIAPKKELLALMSILGFVSVLNARLSDSRELNANLIIDADVEYRESLISSFYSLVKLNGDKVLHVFSHGKSGMLLLDGKWRNAEEISSWLSENYNLKNYNYINIYGCEFAKGEKGLNAVAYLENALGLSVAASDDITGRDGDWKLEVGNSNYSIFIPNYEGNLQYASGQDADGDGILNSVDLDDDNDGILDTVENPCTITQSTTWSGTSSPVTGLNGSNNITVTSVAGSTNGSNTSFTAVPNGTFNTTNFWSNSAVAGDNSFQFATNWDLAGETGQDASVDGGSRTMTITLAQPVNKVILHIDRLGGSNSTNIGVTPFYSNSSEFTLTTSGVSMTKLAGNTQFEVVGNKFFRTPNINLGVPNPGSEANSTNGTAAGTIEFTSSSGLFTTLTFTIIGIGPDVSGTAGDGMEFVFESCIGTDTDGDGIPNNFDLDSDADGCSDVIEGGASFTIANLVNSSMSGGSTSVRSTLCTSSTCVNATGVPTISGSPQTVGSSQQAGTQDANCCTPPTVSAPTVTQPTCAVNTGTIVVNATGTGTLEYSINNGTTWSTSNSFTGLAAGTYTIVVRLQSKPSCSVTYSSNPVTLTAIIGCCGATAANDDYDCDGVINSTDLDDDNDGILDVNEQSCGLFTTNHKLNGGISVFRDNSSTFSIIAGAGSDNNVDEGGAAVGNNNTNYYVAYGTQDESLVQTFSKPVSQVIINNVKHISGSSASNTELFEVYINGAFYPITASMLTGLSGSSFITASGAIGGLTSGAYTSFTKLTITVPTGITSIRIRNNPNGTSGLNGFAVESVQAVYCKLDTDGDGIYDDLDLDSDADGCADALEGAQTMLHRFCKLPHYLEAQQIFKRIYVIPQPV